MGASFFTGNWPMLWITLAVAARQVSTVPKCEENRSSMCSDLYNRTIFPNLQQHRSQEDAIMDLVQYQHLVTTKCAVNLRLFLCSYFIPICTILETPIPPCRSLCEEARNGCEGILKKYVNLPWPEALRCSDPEKFPEDGGDVICIGQPSKKKQIKALPNKKNTINDDEQSVLECPNSESIVIKRLKHEKDGCLRSVSLAAAKILCHGKQRCQFDLSDLVTGSQPIACKPGSVGETTLKYSCQRDDKSHHIRTMHLRYGENVDIQCKGLSRHVVIHQVRSSDPNCLSPNAFCSTSQRCTGLASCILMASDAEIAKHCRAATTNLEITYECAKPAGELATVTANEIEQVKLQCNNQQLLSIVRAEFTGAENCRDKEVTCLVNLLCQNKQSCTIDGSYTSAIRCNSPSRTQVTYVCS